MTPSYSETLAAINQTLEVIRNKLVTTEEQRAEAESRQAAVLAAMEEKRASDLQQLVATMEKLSKAFAEMQLAIEKAVVCDGKQPVNPNPPLLLPTPPTTASEEHQLVSASMKPNLIVEDEPMNNLLVDAVDVEEIGLQLDISDYVFGKSKNEEVDSGKDLSVYDLKDRQFFCTPPIRQNANELTIFSLSTGKPPPLPPEITRRLSKCSESQLEISTDSDPQLSVECHCDEYGVTVLAQLLVDGLILDNLVDPNGLKVCGCLGAVEISRGVHEFTVELGNVIVWNSMIVRYVQSGFNGEAVKLLVYMRMYDAELTRVTMASIQSASANLHLVKKGKQGHALLVLCSLDINIILRSSMINSYGFVGLVEYAEICVSASVPAANVGFCMFFSLAKPDAGNLLIATFALLVAFTTSTILIPKFGGRIIDIVSKYNSASEQHVISKSEGEKLLAAAGQKWKAGGNNCVVKIKAADIREIEELVDKIGVFCDVSELNDMLMALVMADEHELDVKLFSKIMTCHQMVADSGTWSIMIRCYAKMNELGGVRRGLGDLLVLGSKLSVATFTVLISWVATHGTSMSRTNSLISGNNKGADVRLMNDWLLITLFWSVIKDTIIRITLFGQLLAFLGVAYYNHLKLEAPHIVAMGTDGGGSLRVPTALCGVVGLKTSFGRVDMKGSLYGGGTVEVIGPIASSVEDVMLVYAAILGSVPVNRVSLRPSSPCFLILSSNENAQVVGSLSLGKYTEWFNDVDSTDMSDKCQDIVNLLSKTHGYKVMGIILLEMAEMRVAHIISIGYECLSTLNPTIEDVRLSQLTYDFCTSLALFRSFSEAGYVRAQCYRCRIMHYYMEAFKKVDIIVTPTTSMTAPIIPSSAIEVEGTNMQVTGHLMQFIISANLLGVTLGYAHVVNDLEDKVDFKGRGMMENDITKYWVWAGVFSKAHIRIVGDSLYKNV